MALAGRQRPRLIVLPASGGSDPGHPPVTMSPFSMTRKARPVRKQDVFLIDLAKGTAVPAASAGNESTQTPAHLSGTEISIQPVSRLETRKAMAKAGLLTRSDVVDMSALASKLEKRAAALNAELPRKTWQFGKYADDRSVGRCPRSAPRGRPSTVSGACCAMTFGAGPRIAHEMRVVVVGENTTTTRISRYEIGARRWVRRGSRSTRIPRQAPCARGAYNWRCPTGVGRALVDEGAGWIAGCIEPAPTVHVRYTQPYLQDS